MNLHLPSPHILHYPIVFALCSDPGSLQHDDLVSVGEKRSADDSSSTTRQRMEFAVKDRKTGNYGDGVERSETSRHGEDVGGRVIECGEPRLFESLLSVSIQPGTNMVKYALFFITAGTLRKYEVLP